MLGQGIYLIRNMVTDQVYVGSACSFRNRWNRHRLELNKGIHINPKLQNSWNKYGEDAFVFEELLYCSKKDLVHFEQIVMNAYNSYNTGFNLCPVAGNVLGFKHSESFKESLRQRLLGKPGMRRGIPCSQATKEAISRSLLGNTRACGSTRHYSHKPESKRKMSESHKGYVWSEESKAKLRKTMRGRPGLIPSEASRQAMRDGWARRKLKLQEQLAISNKGEMLCQ